MEQQKSKHKAKRAIGRQSVAQKKQSAEDSDASDEDTSQAEVENPDDSDSHDEGMPSLHHFCYNVTFTPTSLDIVQMRSWSVRDEEATA